MSEKNNEVQELRREIQNLLISSSFDKEKTMKKSQMEDHSSLVEFLKLKNNELEAQNIELHKQIQLQSKAPAPSLQEPNYKDEVQRHLKDISRLQFSEDQLQKELNFQKSQVEILRQELIAKEKPIIQRVTEQVPQVVYKENPYLQQKLNEAYDEIEKSLREEKLTKKRLAEKEAELSASLNRVSELEALRFEHEKQIEIIKRQNFISDELEVNKHREILISKNRLKSQVFEFSEKCAKN